MFGVLCVALVVLLICLLLRWILGSTPCRRCTAFGAPLSAALQTSELKGKTVLVTGASSGLGLAAAEYLRRAGATVCTASRSRPASAEPFYELDLGDVRSVDRCAEAFLAEHGDCDTFVLVSGVMDPAQRMPCTAQGFEAHFGINYVGHFRLIEKILPAVKKNNGRVVLVTSLTAQLVDGVKWLDAEPYVERKGFAAYAQSKLAVAMMAKDLARRHPDVGFYAVDPGIVRTAITRTIPGFIDRLWAVLPIAPTAEHGCQTILECAVAPKDELVSGAIYRNCHPITPINPKCFTDDAVEELYKRTFRLVEKFTH